MDVATQKFIDCNQAAAEIFRVAYKEELLGRSPSDLSTPFQYDGSSSSEKALFYIEKAMRDGSIVFEWRHQRADGESLDTEIHLMSFDLGTKKLLQFILIDITERKIAEAKLKKEQILNELLLDTSPAFIVAISSEGETLMMNQSLLNALDYTEEEVLGTNYIDKFVSEEDRELVAVVFKNIIENKEKTVNENRIISKNGKNLLVEWHGTIAVTETDKKLYFIGVGNEITERKNAENKMWALKEYFETIFNHSPFSIAISRLKDRIIYDVDPKFISHTGWTREEILGKTSFEINLWKSVEDRYEIEREIIEKGSIKDREVIIRRKDGSLYYALFNAVKVE
jgi:PAS domain S-box-containing protein